MASETLGAEEAQVAVALAIELIGECSTYGDVVDKLEAATPAERRQLLDRVRVNAGLRDTTRQEQYDAYVQANRAQPTGPLRDAQGRIQARCAHPQCMRFEPDSRFVPVAGEPGVARWVDRVKWWYSEHEHLAAPGDSEPYRSGLAYSASGAIIDLDERRRERERQETAAATRRRRREAQMAERRHDAAESAEVKRAADEQFRREARRGARS